MPQKTATPVKQEQFDCKYINSHTPTATTLKGQIIILGNAYGVMPYQNPLANEFANAGYESHWFPLRGQEEMPGEFSISNGRQDLANAVKFAKSSSSIPEKPLTILAHCATSLITIEYLLSQNSTPVKSVIFYGLLAQPQRLRKKAELRLEKAGVRSALSDDDWNYPTADKLVELNNRQIPMLFCYAEDPINRRRSTSSELQEITGLLPLSSLHPLEQSYDFNNDNVPTAVSKYLDWLDHI
ncbi:MAG: hypothetical protein AAF889_03625 [Cyanobacteria bacterium P01_D01_bin.73]